MRVNSGLLRRFAPRNDGEATSDAPGQLRDASAIDVVSNIDIDQICLPGAACGD
jgi:hypothetical protein